MQSTWKLGLRTAFKNFRRGYLKKSVNDKSLSPPSKRVKICNVDEPDITEEEYEDAIKELQGNYKIFYGIQFSLRLILIFRGIQKRERLMVMSNI